MLPFKCKLLTDLYLNMIVHLRWQVKIRVITTNRKDLELIVKH